MQAKIIIWQRAAYPLGGLTHSLEGVMEDLLFGRFGVRQGEVRKVLLSSKSGELAMVADAAKEGLPCPNIEPRGRTLESTKVER